MSITVYNDSYSSRCDLVQFVISSVPDICTFILYSVISTVLLKKNFKLLEDIGSWHHVCSKWTHRYCNIYVPILFRPFFTISTWLFVHSPNTVRSNITLWIGKYFFFLSVNIVFLIHSLSIYFTTQCAVLIKFASPKGRRFSPGQAPHNVRRFFPCSGWPHCSHRSQGGQEHACKQRVGLENQQDTRNSNIFLIENV